METDYGNEYDVGYDPARDSDYIYIDSDRPISLSKRDLLTMLELLRDED